MAYTAKLLISDVVTTTKNDTVQDAVQKMKRAKTGCCVVVDGKKPIGIFTERDLLNRVVGERKDPSVTTVGSAMTTDPVTVDSAESLDRVFLALADRRFRNIPITEKGELVGLVGLSDLAAVLREVYREDKYIQYFVDFFGKGAQAAAK